MAWLKKKQPDPISERANALNSQIAALEAQIKQLDAQLHKGTGHPRLRSTAVPHGATITHTATSPATPPPTHEPVFEELNHAPLKTRPDPAVTTREHYNELGMRKYDLTALLGWFKGLFHAPKSTNPRLISYLAAGGVQGLQPLRKEKRVARNRFIAFASVLFFVLLGILWWFLRSR